MLSLKNFYGLNTVKRKISPQYAREIQDMVIKKGLTRVRPGFTKDTDYAFSGAILGMFNYKRKNGVSANLLASDYGSLYDGFEWPQYGFGEIGGFDFPAGFTYWNGWLFIADRTYSLRRTRRQ